MRKLAVLLLGLVVSGCDSDLPGDAYISAVANAARPAADKKLDEFRRPAEVLRFTGVDAGEMVVDILGGSGYFTELLSHLVGPDGMVFIQNNAAFLGRSETRLAERLADARLPNVSRIDSELDNMRLPEGVDLIILSTVYHDVLIENKGAVEAAAGDGFLAQLSASLVDDGRVLVIDHGARPGQGLAAAKTLHRIGEEIAIQRFYDAGFRLVGTSNALRNPDDDLDLNVFEDTIRYHTDRYILLFQKANLR